MNIIEYEAFREEKVHGNPIFPYNTYLCSIPLDFQEVPTHWHDEIELIYVKKGIGTATVDFHSYRVTGPSLLLILPGQLHGIRQHGTDTMEYENIIFHPSLLDSRQNDPFSQEYLLPFLNGELSLPTLFTPQTPHYREITAPIDACDQIRQTRPHGYPLYIKSQLFQFLYILTTYCQNSIPQNKNRKQLARMKPILKYIENHYGEKITITQIARTAGFSEAHFMRFFKESMGSSFITYLNNYRLTMAARLLSLSDATILTISEEVGFPNLSHFNRAFKKKYQLTPSQYRKSSC